MALDPRLLEILVCPACREGLDHKDRRHVLVCRGCGRQYPVREGIPVMLVEEAAAPKGRS